jgi:adenosylmethionine-8-amino-7-oxononanoate aminotransferase
VACAVSLKVLEIYQRDNIFERAAKMGDYLQRRLDAFHDHPLVGEVRGRGLIAAVELVADKASGKAFDGGVVGAFAQRACEQHGLIVRAVAGSSIAFCPPLIITQAQIDEMIEKFGKALADTQDFVTREKLVA